MINLLDMTCEEVTSYIISQNEPKFRGKQIYSWLYKGISSFEDMLNIPKSLREKLTENCTLGQLEIAEKFVSDIDETRKYLLQLNDGNYIETVLMKYHHGYTLCVSSQVGCRMGCKFCASTLNGKVRDLTPGEIIGQILAVQNDLGERISNIVMMGIGEPLDNYDNVMKFLEIVSSPEGLNIGMRHISLSTCGLVPKIYELADEKLQITLSISLHATDDKMRSSIMPVNNKYNIEKLIDACRYYIEKTNRRISFEYTLISGVNDNIETADALIKLLSGMLCHVNLIPVNAVSETGFKKTDRKKVEAFQARLEKNGISATIRREMGSDISAACGQLRNKKTQSERMDINGN
ncbi:MAG: 23S rRNA (adenine(2503)-C(2))-methyltransferase RlmN [Clostridia bacterium]|nr:23S rRNA (adenine(2503)-C(2))-methyltransferase RlmN [Clostridia bacterium]